MTQTDKSSDAPISIGQVVLTVHDLDATASFYERVLGLVPLERDAGSAKLGAGGRPLIELRRDPDARRRDPAEAGLFHTAFLLPDRMDLGRWARNALDTGTRLEGAADHLVSEALYLSDPEGNGIEVYADRPRATWRRDRDTGALKMSNERLDLDGLIALSDAPWTHAPEDSVIGHVHLQVGEIASAERFYGKQLGAELTCRFPGASFFGWGGYHHHLGANIWNSRGAGPRRYPATGLAEVELLVRLDADPVPSALGPDAGDEVRDPWGSLLTVTRTPN